MTRALLFTVVAGSIVSILSYAGSQALNPSVYDVLECVADAGGVDRCSAGGPEQPISSGEQPGSLAQVVDRYFAPLVETNNFYGAVFAARGDEVLVHKGYGWASIELAVPNSAESVFHIASVSKPITAAAVMLLSERGLVDLNAPLSRILSDYPNGDRLSLHNLLLHTSGIPDINVQPVYADLSHSHRTPAELVDAFKNLPLMFEPGARFQYSNSNYNLLALVIERVSGMSYGEFLEKEIFGPLEMDHTAHPERDATIVPHLVEGYAPIGRSELERAPWINWTVKTGNGSLYSTGEDLAKWVRGFFGGQILSPATLNHAAAAKHRNRPGARRPKLRLVDRSVPRPKESLVRGPQPRLLGRDQLLSRRESDDRRAVQHVQLGYDAGGGRDRLDGVQRAVRSAADQGRAAGARRREALGWRVSIQREGAGAKHEDERRGARRPPHARAGFRGDGAFCIAARRRCDVHSAQLLDGAEVRRGAGRSGEGAHAVRRAGRAH
jgi:CubicO group peptidase (beta-lactamase class C family)